MAHVPAAAGPLGASPSMFFWVMGFACFAAPSAACVAITSDVDNMEFKQNGGSPKVGDNGDCIDVSEGCDEIEKKGFHRMGFTMTVNVDYASSADTLSIDTQGFKETDIILNMECKPGADCGDGNCASYSDCGCDIRPLSHDGGPSSITVNSCCNGFTGCGAGPVSPSPDPPPPPPSPPPPSPSPPAAAPVVCGPGTTLDGNTCKIDCDESNPPGRRLSENPFAPADADASDTARESREQSARAGKAIDSYLASQPDLDDALRSVISPHLKRFAAEILWFTEEE